MRIAQMPDPHCYYNTYAKLDANKISSRKKEWLHITETMVQECIKAKVDVVTVGGDLYTNPRPTAEQILMISELFKKFEENNIKILAIPGNHDIGGEYSTIAPEIVAEIGGNPLWCVSKFDITVINDVGFAFLPFVKNPNSLLENPELVSQETSQQLVNISKALFIKLKENKKVKSTVLLGHWTIQGAISSSNQSLAESTKGAEVIIPLGELVNTGWDACFFNHIHKPQVLCESPFISHSGALQRSNIGEANDKRGFFIYDTETKCSEFIDLPAKEMLVITGEIKRIEDVEQFYQKIYNSDVKDKIVQVKYTLLRENLNLIDKQKIYDILKAKEIDYLVDISPIILDIQRSRDITINETLDKEEALKKWLENKNVPNSKKDKVLASYEKYKNQLNFIS